MEKKKVLVWETLATVSGGQKMTLTVMDMLANQYEFYCLIPAEGIMSEELKKRNINYALMGDQTLPIGMKGKKAVFRYGWLTLKNIIMSLRVIRTYNPDILYAPGPAALPWSAICGLLSHKPVIWHLHHIFLDGATKKLLNICGKFKAVKKIIAVSNCVGNQMVDDIARAKVQVLYNPVDIEKYSSGNADNIKKEIEKKLGYVLRNIDPKSIILGHVALVQRSKCQDLVLDLIAGLREKGYNPIGIFVGEVREPEFLSELKQKATRLEIADRVLFMGRRNDIPDLLQLIDILIIPSSFEGFPLIGLEAASACVPVVACNVAGAEEFVRVSRAGTTFSENDADSAIKAVEVILDEYNIMKINGKAFAEKCNISNYQIAIEDSFRL